MSEVLTRFFAKIEKTDTCWNWVGAKISAGYGTFRYRGKVWKAHRVSYTELVGEIPTGLTIDHLCRNRACVNPEHLEAVTHAENTRRGDTASSINARKTHCIRGHEFTSDNTYTNPASGARQCRVCISNRVIDREAKRAYDKMNYRRKKEASIGRISSGSSDSGS